MLAAVHPQGYFPLAPYPDSPTDPVRHGPVTSRESIKNRPLTKTDLTVLAKNLEKGSCVLMLGTGVEVVGKDGMKHNLVQELARELAEALGEDVDNASNLPHMAQRYSREHDRNYLEEEIEGFYRDRESALSEDDLLMKLARLPFRLIVTTRHDDTFERCLEAVGKHPVIVPFGMTNQVPRIPDGSCTTERPLVFCLAGKLTDLSSMVLTEDDILALMDSIMSKRPGLPDRVIFECSRRNAMAILIGFGVPNWHTRVILSAVGMNKDSAQSFAFGEFDAFLRATDREAAFFYEDEFNIRTVFDRSERLVDLVTDRWRELGANAPSADTEPEAKPVSPPKVFISYCSERVDDARKLHDKLLERGLDPFFDKERIDGGDRWRQVLEEEIRASLFFVLMVSPEIFSRPESVVFREVREAMDREKDLPLNSKFFFPVQVAGEEKKFDDPHFAEIQHQPLTDSDEDRDALASRILKEHQRRSRR